MKYIFIYLSVFFVGLLSLQAQRNDKITLTGHVYLDSIGCKHAEVTIGGIARSVFTDAKGFYELNNLPSGKFVVYALHEDGYMQAREVELNQKNNQLDFYIQSDGVVLDELTVKARRKIDDIKLNPIKAEVVDVVASQEKATNIQALLNTSPGVRLRTTGTLGASSDLIINGFSGRSIKLMRDGIPLDYLGSSFGITKIPLNSVERIEVYKGVLPAEIGIDALGGAVNLVSRRLYSSEYQVSLERGSFNTTVGTLSGLSRLNKNLSVGVYGFGNYSDNNYKVKNLPYYDKETGQNTYITAPLFHNSFKQYFVEGYLNIDNLSWVNLLQFRITSFGIHQDLQNDFTTRDRAFGAVYRTEKATVIPSVTFRKALLNGKLNTTQFLVYSQVNNAFVDTLRNAYYDWKGVRHSATSGSEIGSTLSSNPDRKGIHSIYKNIVYRGLLSYKMHPAHLLTLNVMENFVKNKRDDYSSGALEYKNTDYNRLIIGVGHNGTFLKNKLNTIVQAKSLFYTTKGIPSTIYDINTQREEEITNKHGISYSLSAKYSFTKNLLLRASFENTYRMPDQMEIFGDNTFIISNLNLAPEQSKNLNIGIKWYKPNRYNFEINSYFRNTKDLIKLKELNQYQGVFLNLEKVKGYGVEMDAFYLFFDRLKLRGNLTYNEFRYNGSLDEQMQDAHFQDARVSNMPFYYGNLGAEYIVNNIRNKENRLRLYWNYSYVHQYYLDYIEKQFEPDGFLGLFGKSKIYTNRVIPQQHLHTAGATFEFRAIKNNRVTIGVEMRNVFDADIYNNFKMQSPGRSFWAKAVYLIK